MDYDDIREGIMEAVEKSLEEFDVDLLGIPYEFSVDVKARICRVVDGIPQCEKLPAKAFAKFKKYTSAGEMMEYGLYVDLGISRGVSEIGKILLPLDASEEFLNEIEDKLLEFLDEVAENSVYEVVKDSLDTTLRYDVASNNEWNCTYSEYDGVLLCDIPLEDDVYITMEIKREWR